MSNLALIVERMTMSSREISGLCKKDHKHVLTDIRKMLEELEIQPAGFSADYKDSMGRTYPCFRLPRRECDILISGYSIKYRAAIVDRWRELETQNARPEKSLLPGNYIEALEALVESEKQKQIAIDTKAEIGTRREATAMNTASQAVKKSSLLEIELDQSKKWSTIKRMEILTGLKFNWRVLKSSGADLNMTPKDVFDPNFGTVKAYHRDVWAEAYALDISQ
jgi:phage regulator Rha-like protein